MDDEVPSDVLTLNDSDAIDDRLAVEWKDVESRSDSNNNEYGDCTPTAPEESLSENIPLIPSTVPEVTSHEPHSVSLLVPVVDDVKVPTKVNKLVPSTMDLEMFVMPFRPGFGMERGRLYPSLPNPGHKRTMSCPSDSKSWIFKSGSGKSEEKDEKNTSEGPKDAVSPDCGNRETVAEEDVGVDTRDDIFTWIFGGVTYVLSRGYWSLGRK